MRPSKTSSWYMFVLLRNRWFLIKALLIIMVPTVVITFLLGKKYTVTTVIMPPETQSSYGLSLAGLGLSEFAGFFSGGMGFSLPLMTTMSDVYEQILESRTLVEDVILTTDYLDEADVRDKYEANEQLGLYWARKKFMNNYSVSVTPSGFLQIEVTTGDPWYSVEVSERVVAVLDSINTSIAVSRATQAREYLDVRSTSANNILTTAAMEMQLFEEEHGIISLDQEMEAFVRTLADIKQQYMELMAQASAIRRGIAGGNNAAALMKEREAEALASVISMLETGIAPPGYEDVMPSIPMNDLPEVIFQYARLRANYEMALELATIVEVSLQQAIVEENRDQPAVRVLDPPRHPGWKSRPKRIYIWVEVFILAFVGLFGFLIMRENYLLMRKERPEEWQRWNGLLSDIKGDFSRRSRKSRNSDR